MFPSGGDVGSLVNVAGVGVLAPSDRHDTAFELVEWLLSDDAQQYFADETFEYPLISAVDADDRLPPLEEIATPDIDLSDLADLQGTVEMLRDVGALD